MGKARDMRVANRFDEAVAYLDQGERIHPGTMVLDIIHLLINGHQLHYLMHL